MSMRSIPYSSLPVIPIFSSWDILSSSSEDPSFTIATRVGISSLLLLDAWLSLYLSGSYEHLDNERPTYLHLPESNSLPFEQHGLSSKYSSSPSLE